MRRPEGQDGARQPPDLFDDDFLIGRGGHLPARVWAFAAPSILLEEAVVATEGSGHHEDSQPLPSTPPPRKAEGWFSWASSLPERLSLQPQDRRLHGDEQAADDEASASFGFPSSERWRGLLLSERPEASVVLPERMVDPLADSFVPENLVVRTLSDARAGHVGEVL
jgi:hypothetical protein